MQKKSFLNFDFERATLYSHHFLTTPTYQQGDIMKYHWLHECTYFTAPRLDTCHTYPYPQDQISHFQSPFCRDIYMIHAIGTFPWKNVPFGIYILVTIYYGLHFPRMNPLLMWAYFWRRWFRLGYLYRNSTFNNAIFNRKKQSTSLLALK